VIPAGQVTGRFTVNLGSTAVRKTVRVNAYAGQETVFTDVSAGPVALLAIAANPYVTGAGRTTTTNRVTLSGPAPSGGVSVAMASTDATIAAPAPTVDVPAGTTTTNN
jgi:hypothetical protein